MKEWFALFKSDSFQICSFHQVFPLLKPKTKELITLVSLLKRVMRVICSVALLFQKEQQEWFALLRFPKERRERFALLLYTKGATRVICSNWSLQKEQQERFAILKRANRTFTLSLSKNSWFPLKTKEQIPNPAFLSTFLTYPTVYLSRFLTN